MRKVILLIICVFLLSACGRDQIRDVITDSLRRACAQNSANCSIHCPIGETSDQRGDCSKD
jgi:hypothetical protein